MKNPHVTVTALQPVQFDGILYGRGDTFLVPVVEALVLAQKHAVSLTRRVAATPLSASPVPVKRGRGRPPKYRG